ncbi:Catalase-related peroxidase [Aquisphaera giovannonii]|uniref:Catalase-related peroxidase n=1 Tax=Aquisphaera giovannonii TaxID=406548 RepID=A0A5B9W5B8_9BACT|nr:catalase family peroxidase [Aquisphaera giovannonii]QEH35822.1 Catalase-related peroxidase [Aquisphaera giovannonii]
MNAAHRFGMVIVLASLIAGGAVADDPRGLPEQIVDEMNAIFGKHPGFRAVHAKGVVAEGEFTPSARAATVSKAPHLRGAPSKITVRFSDGTGNPEIPDGLAGAGPRGMAVKFHLADGESTDIVANAFNGFAVSNGEDFLAMLRAIAASGKGAPSPTPLEQFLAAHPAAKRVVAAHKPVPASFATEPYFGNNALSFTDAEGKSRFGRYRLIPEAGSKFLDDAEAKAKPPNFLADELRSRLAGGPARFRLAVQLAAPGDKVDDATVVWPDDRPVIELGILSISRVVADSATAQRALAYDPLRLVDGIEASDDPLLELRSAVYAESRRRRR